MQELAQDGSFLAVNDSKKKKMLRMKKDHFNFQNSFLIVKGVCVLGYCCSVNQSCPTLRDTWIEGAYSERRNGQMQRHEIKQKKRNE